MDKKPVSQILKEHRKKHKLSAKFVCDYLKSVDGISISPPTLYGYENGHRKPTPETLLALCDLYSIDNLALEFGFSTVKELDEAEDLEFEKSEKLNKAFYSLNEKGQSIAVERIEELAKIPDYQKKKGE